jgi:hypothetical protein
MMTVFVVMLEQIGSYVNINERSVTQISIAPVSLAISVLYILNVKMLYRGTG